MDPEVKKQPVYSKTWNEFIDKAMAVLVENPS